jgi:hypothetical protein
LFLNTPLFPQSVAFQEFYLISLVESTVSISTSLTSLMGEFAIGQASANREIPKAIAFISGPSSSRMVETSLGKLLYLCEVY